MSDGVKLDVMAPSPLRAQCRAPRRFVFGDCAALVS
jgi:hypothetical protein